MKVEFKWQDNNRNTLSRKLELDSVPTRGELVYPDHRSRQVQHVSLYLADSNGDPLPDNQVHAVVQLVG